MITWKHKMHIEIWMWWNRLQMQMWDESLHILLSYDLLTILYTKDKNNKLSGSSGQIQVFLYNTCTRFQYHVIDGMTLTIRFRHHKATSKRFFVLHPEIFLHKTAQILWEKIRFYELSIVQMRSSQNVIESRTSQLRGRDTDHRAMCTVPHSLSTFSV